MRAFVTGGTGFIGSRVVKRLRDRGDEVVVLARRPEKASGPRRRGGAGRPLGRRRDPPRRRGLPGRLPHRRRLPRGHGPLEARLDARLEHRAAPSGCSTRRSTPGVDRIVYVSTINIFGNTNGQTVDETYRRNEADGFVSTYDETKYRAH